MSRNGVESRNRTLLLEALEQRQLLSIGRPLPAGWHATPPIKVPSLMSPHAGSAQGLSPNQIRGAYGLGSYTNGVLTGGVTFGGISGDGRGQTIAIIDAYDNPYAASDINYFSDYFGLPRFGGPGNPTFTKLNQYGGKTLPSPDFFGGWGVEEMLDIEWAHAMAPMANIILFEATDASNYLFTAVQTAAATPGVVCISMSWGGAEFLGEDNFDSTYFTTPVGHLGGADSVGGTLLPGGITFLSSTGDNGAYDRNFFTTITPNYPASSPNVLAVGGTTLTVNGSDPTYTYGGETSWGNGTLSGLMGAAGGGISAFESQPFYQQGVVRNYSTTQRTYPDVCANASPDSGAAVYDTWDYGGWVPGGVGGTSLSCPLWAGIIAVADEGRAIVGAGSLDGPSETVPKIYTLPTADLHDVTSGSAIGPSPTYSPGAGYDLATGLGSPLANLVIPALCPKGLEVTGISPIWGPLSGGTKVTITGYGLANATAVKFGSSLATIVSNTSSKIVAISPPGAGTVDVTVVGPAGTSAITPADRFHYVVTMSEVAKLTASNGAAQNYFGRSVAVSGNTVVVGSPFATVGKNAYQGAVYVYTGSGSTWTQTAELTATGGSADNYFGQSVAIDGNTIVVGAIGANSYLGAAYVFTGSGSTWTQTAKLAASDGTANSYFGSSVSINGTTIVVGADGAKVRVNLGQGAAYVFTGSGAAWTQAARLTASDGAAGDWFGSSVSVSGTTVAVGAYYAAINGNFNQGAAYVFAQPASGWASMTQTAKLTAPDGTENNFLGLSVAISGNTVVLGTYAGTAASGDLGQGAVYVFTKPASGWASFIQGTKLTASDGTAHDFFGDSVSISGNRIVVGAWGITGGQGSAYVFTLANSTWTQTAQLTLTTGITDTINLGYSVAISGSTVVVGAPLATVGVNAGQGAAYVYALGPAPSFAINGTSSGSGATSKTVSIKWNAANVPSGSTISLAYIAADGLASPRWIEIDGVAATNGSGSLTWSTAGLTPGTYYVAGYLYAPSSGTKVLSQLMTSFTVAASSGTALASSVTTNVDSARTIHEQALLAFLQS